jgi:phage-related protein
MSSRDTRPISWVSAARKSFEKFPKRAQLDMLAALTIAADGEKADIAKPLKGFGSGVFEVALKYRTDAFRTVYALQLGMDVWVLHAFQKKAKTGITTPKKELELVSDRLKRLKKELRQ